MQSISGFFQQQMTAVMVVYGLSFFVVFFAIFLQRGRTAHFGLLDAFIYLAGFGFLHGLADLVFLLPTTLRIPSNLALDLREIKLVLFILSFQLLMHFALGAFFLDSSVRSRVMVLTSPIIVAIYFLVFFYNNELTESWRAARYFFAFPAAAMAAGAFFWLSRRFGRVGLTGFVASLRVAAFAFGAYSSTFLAPYTYPNTYYVLGVPVQGYRTAAMLVVAFATLRIMGVFKLEPEFEAVPREALREALPQQVDTEPPGEVAIAPPQEAAASEIAQNSAPAAERRLMIVRPPRKRV